MFLSELGRSLVGVEGGGEGEKMVLWRGAVCITCVLSVLSVA